MDGQSEHFFFAEHFEAGFLEEVLFPQFKNKSSERCAINELKEPS